MKDQRITDIHNKCVEILNQSDLSMKELVTVLAQLLIYTGGSITQKEIDIHNIDLDSLNREYYADNSKNDIGLGLILNGASIMGAIKNINGNVTAKQGESQ